VLLRELLASSIDVAACTFVLLSCLKCTMVKVEVKIEHLADTNWGTWAPRMEMLLTLEGYMDISSMLHILY
jgi:hypothetical protein